MDVFLFSCSEQVYLFKKEWQVCWRSRKSKLFRGIIDSRLYTHIHSDNKRSLKRDILWLSALSCRAICASRPWICAPYLWMHSISGGMCTCGSLNVFEWALMDERRGFIISDVDDTARIPTPHRLLRRAWCLDSSPCAGKMMRMNFGSVMRLV